MGRQLLSLARQASVARQTDAVEQACQAMLALPLSESFKRIARYYQTEALVKRGDCDHALPLLESIAEEATPEYRARALQSIGATNFLSGKADAALPFFVAAAKAAEENDLLTVASAHWNTAVVRSLHGDHKQAVADLERIFPMVRVLARLYPFYYYDYLNSLAVELGGAGRIKEAQSALSIALASPFAPAHPEWSETRDELQAKRASGTHSIIAVERIPKPALSAKLQKCRNHHRSIRRNREPAASRLGWLVGATESLTRVLSHPAARTIAAIHSAARPILDRLDECIKARGPPGPSRAAFRYSSDSVVQEATSRRCTGAPQLLFRYLCVWYPRLETATSGRVLRIPHYYHSLRNPNNQIPNLLAMRRRCRNRDGPLQPISLLRGMLLRRLNTLVEIGGL